MINGAHVILYTGDAEADRGFIRDVLGLAGVDVGGGWVIFKLPPAEIAVHPTEAEPQHEFYFLCDDIAKTTAELRAKGVTVSEVDQQRWGLLVSVTLPSGARLPLYQPLHQTAYDLPE
jgi:catechol 2,3-dioxygenase-like lactoylglutathione lyase family enzyme